MINGSYTRRRLWVGALVRSSTSRRPEDGNRSRMDGCLDCGRENFRDFTLEAQRNAAVGVMFGRASVDDHVRYPAARSHQRERGCRVNGEGGAERHDEVGLLGRVVRAFENLSETLVPNKVAPFSIDGLQRRT